MSETTEAVRTICDTIIKRIDRAYVARCGKNGEFPQKLWDLWVDTGLLAIGLPEEYGGAGGTVSDVVLALDLLHQAGLLLPVAITNYMSRTPILRHGTEEQKHKYLPPTVTGKAYFSFGITEPDSGTNTFNIKTSAQRQSDGSYVINGQKAYMTAFKGSAHTLLVARTSKYDAKSRTSGISLFIVDTKSEGISYTPMEIAAYLPEKNYMVYYADVAVPKENRLGEEGRGLEVLFDSLNPERLFTAAIYVGQADHVLNRAAEYAKARAPFGKPIGSYQAIQHPLARAKTHVEAARTMLYKAADKYDSGGSIGLEANMVKILSSEAFQQAADIAMTTFGGAGLDLSQDILPFFISSKLAEVGPVNNQVVLSYIAEHALGLPKSY